MRLHFVHLYKNYVILIILWYCKNCTKSWTGPGNDIVLPRQQNYKLFSKCCCLGNRVEVICERNWWTNWVLLHVSSITECWSGSVSVDWSLLLCVDVFVYKPCLTQSDINMTHAPSIDARAHKNRQLEYQSSATLASHSYALLIGEEMFAWFLTLIDCFCWAVEMVAWKTLFIDGILQR